MTPAIRISLTATSIRKTTAFAGTNNCAAARPSTADWYFPPGLAGIAMPASAAQPEALTHWPGGRFGPPSKENRQDLAKNRRDDALHCQRRDAGWDGLRDCVTTWRCEWLRSAASTEPAISGSVPRDGSADFWSRRHPIASPDSRGGPAPEMGRHRHMYRSA